MSTRVVKNEEPTGALSAIDAQCKVMIGLLQNGGVIDSFCDAIMSDLQAIRLQAQKFGISRVVNRNRLLSHCSLSGGPFVGNYISIGIGQQWLELGQLLERQTIKALRARFRKKQTAFEQRNSHEIETMMSTIVIHDEYYRTESGVFMLSRTYASFVGIRVD